jgi:hypothetical protein
MKKLNILLIGIAVILLSACVGEQGVPGFDGEDGESFLGSVFEIEGDFSSNNDYKLFFEFPENFQIYESDIVMAYILWDQAEGNNGMIDIWRPLPQSIVLQEGILQYNFDYTINDVEIFIDGDIDFNSLLPAEKDNQVFRIAVFPAAFAENKSLDINNLGSVMNLLNIEQKSIETLTIESVETIIGIQE